MANRALDYFGEVLMTRVRDAAIGEVDSLVQGRMKHDKGRHAKKLFSKMPREPLQAVQWLVPEVVDVTLHHLPWMLEDRAGTIRLMVDSGEGVCQSLADTSDGLTGQPYTEYGWIARFSRERSNPF